MEDEVQPALGSSPGADPVAEHSNSHGRLLWLETCHSQSKTARTDQDKRTHTKHTYKFMYIHIRAPSTKAHVYNMQFYFLMLRFCRLLLALPAKKNLHSLSSIINHIRLINILAVTLFKQPSLHPKSTGKYFRIQDDHPTALPLNANLTELCKPAQ